MLPKERHTLWREVREALHDRALFWVGLAILAVLLLAADAFGPMP